MSSISDLAKNLVTNMNTKNDEKIESAAQQIVTQVKEVVVKEVIHDELNIDISGLATKEEIPDVSSFVTQNDIDTAIVDKADKSDLDGLASQTDVDNALALKANTGDVNELLSAKANKDDLPDFDTFAVKSDVETSLAGKANVEDIPDVSGKIDIEAANAALETKADKTDLSALKSSLFTENGDGVFSAGWTAQDGSTHRIELEEGDFGGIFAYNQPQDTKLFVGLNKATSNDDIDGQIYAIKKSDSIGTRLNISKDKGIFYAKGTTNLGTLPENELAVKGDIPDISDLINQSAMESALEGKADKEDTYSKSEVLDLLENKANLTDIYTRVETYSAEKIQELLDLEANADSVYTISQVDNMLAEKADKTDIPDVSNFLTADDIADKADKSDIPDISGLASKTELSTSLAVKADAADLENLVTKDEFDDLEIPSVEGLASETYVDNAVAGKLDASKVWNVNGGYFDTTYTHANGSYAKLWNESDGGGSQYINSTADIVSYVGTNDGDANGVCVQIYSKYKNGTGGTKNSGTRLNVNPNGIYYTKGTDTSTMGTNGAKSELATLNDIPDVSNFITANDIADKLDASKVWNANGNYFDTTNSLANGSYAKIWNESSGGGAQAYTQPSDTLSFVGVNHWNDDDKVACQIYTKNKSTNLGVRMSFHPTLGAFYTKGVTGGNANNFASGREIAVKDDVDTLTNRIAELEALVATLQDALENAVDSSGNPVYTKPTTQNS